MTKEVRPPPLKPLSDDHIQFIMDNVDEEELEKLANHYAHFRIDRMEKHIAIIGIVSLIGWYLTLFFMVMYLIS